MSEGRPEQGVATTGVSPDPGQDPLPWRAQRKQAAGLGGCVQGPACGRTDGSEAGQGLTQDRAWLECGSTWAGTMPRSSRGPGNALSSFVRGLGVKKRKAHKTVVKAS